VLQKAQKLVCMVNTKDEICLYIPKSYFMLLWGFGGVLWAGS